MFDDLKADVQEIYSPEMRGHFKEEGDIIIKIIDTILSHTVRENVSDIHIEPQKSFLLVRFRKDGVLYDALELRDPNVVDKLVSSIRVQAAVVDYKSGTNKAVDGRWSVNFGYERVDFRLSFFPTIKGEKLVMRIFRQSRAVYELDKIGMTDHEVNILKRFLMRKNGIVFVAGPTGACKTTTLFFK